MSHIFLVLQSLKLFEIICLWDLIIVSIYMSVAICQLPIRQLCSFGKNLMERFGDRPDNGFFCRNVSLLHVSFSERFRHFADFRSFTDSTSPIKLTKIYRITVLLFMTTFYDSWFSF